MANNSLYEKLGEINPDARDKFMAEMGLTREMVDRNISFADYLRETGKQDAAAKLSAPPLPNSFVKSTSPNLAYIAPTISSQTNVPLTSQSNTVVYNMAQRPGPSEEAAMYSVARKAVSALDNTISMTRVLKTMGKMSHEMAKASASGVDDAADLVAQFKSTVGETTSHMVDDLMQMGTSGASSVLGPLFTGLGYMIDNRIVGNLEKQIAASYVTYCKAELKIAADYNKRTTNSLGFRKWNKSPTDIERYACGNLWETMEFNGGSQLLGRKINRDLGLVAGLFGGPGGGLGVYAAVKAMESGDGVPSPEQLCAQWSTLNKISIAGGAILGTLFPPSLIFTGPAWIAMNVAASGIVDDVKKWHEARSSEKGRNHYMQEMGKLGEKLIHAKPLEFTDEALRIEMLANAESAAKRIAKGPSQHTREDVRVLVRYSYTAPHFYEKPSSDETFPALKERHEAVLKFIADTQLRERSNYFIACAAGKGRAV